MDGNIDSVGVKKFNINKIKLLIHYLEKLYNYFNSTNFFGLNLDNYTVVFL